MTILVLAEHNNTDIKSSTLNTISAASQIEQEIDVLVTGFQCEELAKKISKCKIIGVSILTSLNNKDLKMIGYNKSVKNLVAHQAKLAKRAALDLSLIHI